MQDNLPMTVGLVGLGCAKNFVDLETMAATLLLEDYELSRNPDEADIILVNTCAFIQDARQEAADEIKRACELKKKGSARFVIVSGCLSQRYGKKLIGQFPDVDAFVGIDHLFDLPEIIEDLVEASEKGGEFAPIVRVSDAKDKIFEPPLPNLSLTGLGFSYVKIAEGCNHKCAYCAIPGIRGNLRSRLMREITAEVRELVNTGVREIVLVAQDTTAYGKDLKNDTTLVKLLAKLDRIKGDFLIRILYGYPAYITDELIAFIAASKHIARYIDVPIQHSHPDILKAMRRTGTIKDVPLLAKRIREICPEMAVRTTCLVGFPGETDEHFEDLLKHIKEAKYDELGVFAFSPEEDTVAAAMENQVPAEVAERRREILMAAQKEIATEKLKDKLGKKIQVALDTQTGENSWVARSEFQAHDVDSSFIVSGVPADCEVGDWIYVIPSEISDYDLIAEYTDTDS